MKKLVAALTAIAAFTGSASAADIAARPYTKAPAPVAAVYNWTGFYVFGGAGGGLWSADSNVQSTGVVGPFGAFGAAGTPLTRDQRLGGSGWFGTVGAGYDWQFNGRWVAGVFADGQFGDISGSLADPFFGTEGREKLRTSYAAGARLGYLVAPNVLSYVNAGYSGSEWSGTSQTPIFVGAGIPTAVQTSTGSFHRDGFFVGGGVENNLGLFGITAPGWFMKTEYRSAYYDRISRSETFAPGNGFGFGGAAVPVGPTGTAVTFKPWNQTISTSLVYRFNSAGTASTADMARPYSKAPAAVATAYNWTGFHLFGGAGGGLWAADSNVQSTGVVGPFGAFGAAGTVLNRDQRLGGSGWFGSVGAGYDWQFSGRWVVGVFGDGQFGDIGGSLSDLFVGVEGREKLRISYAAGVRLGYLVAPNVLSYVNAGYSGSEWSGTSLVSMAPAGGPVFTTTGSFHRDGWFVGGGVENNLDIFGIAASGWFMKTEYRSAFYDRISRSETIAPTNGFGFPVAPTGTAVTFKPWTQTISTSLVYRFNSGGPVVAKY